MYAGDHGDRAYGLIDEVRISDLSLAPGEFINAPEPASLTVITLAGALLGRRRKA